MKRNRSMIACFRMESAHTACPRCAQSVDTLPRRLGEV